MSELIAQEIEAERRTLLSQARVFASRLGLSVALGIGGAIVSQATEGIVSEEVASASAEGYPWKDAPCQFGDAGGTQCTNPQDPTDKYDWYWDENGNGKFDGTTCAGSAAASECFDQRGYQYRNCTSYVAWRINKEFGVDLINWGNGSNWDDKAVGKYVVDSTPEPGDIAVWNGGFGHVAFVESVNSDGSINVAQYNGAGKGEPSIARRSPASSYIDINGTGIIWKGGGGGGGKVDYAAVAEGQEFYSEQGWVYTKVGGSAWPIKHKDNWNSGDQYNWGGEPVGPVSTAETHDHEVGYSNDGQRSEGENPPRDGTVVYLQDGQQQYYFLRGNAYPITAAEVDELRVRNQARMIPLTGNRLADFQNRDLPLASGEVYRVAGNPYVRQFISDANGVRSYWVTNETTKECLRVVYNRPTMVIPQSARETFWTQDVSTPAACAFPAGFVLRGPGGVEQWRINGDGSSQPYWRQYFPNDLTTYLHTGGAPQYHELQSVAAINNVPEGPNMTLPNGQFFVNDGNGDTFKIENGIFRKVLWPEQLTCLGSPSVVHVPGDKVGIIPQGEPMSCAYENRIIARPDGRAYYIEGGRAHQIGTPAVRDCIAVRRGAGQWVQVADSTVDTYTPSTPAYCPYETESGLNFVQEQGDPTVWLVKANGIKQHVGSLCVSDPYTTPLKNYRVWTVPRGETAGHVQDGVFWANGAACDALPKP